ncbi:MAG: hypothetical protein SO122_07565 [Eubacteriales bacterium]|nr:hypothetical protein [Eubacteriales bacterium]
MFDTEGPKLHHFTRLPLLAPVSAAGMVLTIFIITSLTLTPTVAVMSSEIDFLISEQTSTIFEFSITDILSLRVIPLISASDTTQSAVLTALFIFAILSERLSITEQLTNALSALLPIFSGIDFPASLSFLPVRTKDNIGRTATAIAITPISIRRTTEPLIRKSAISSEASGLMI